MAEPAELATIPQTNGHGNSDKFVNSSRNTVAKHKTALMQLTDLQRKAHQAALDPDTPIKDRSALMRAWCDLQEEKRKLLMRPLPKSIDVSKLGKGKRKAQSGPAYQEPGPNQAPEQAKPVAPVLQPKPDPS